MDGNDTEGREEAAGLAVTPEEKRWLTEVAELAVLYQQRAETFVRFKSARPVRVSGKLIPVTDAMAENQTFVETGVKIMLQEARVSLAARRMESE